MPTASDTEVHVLVTEQACTGATEIGDRMIGPEVTESEEQVVIVFGVRPLELGMYNCPGNPPLPVTVVLAGPIGDRVLADSNSYPPRPVQSRDR